MKGKVHPLREGLRECHVFRKAQPLLVADRLRFSRHRVDGIGVGERVQSAVILQRLKEIREIILLMKIRIRCHILR